MFSMLCCSKWSQSVEMLSFLLYAITPVCVKHFQPLQNKRFFVSISTQTVCYQRTHLCRHRPGTAVRWHGFQSGPLLSWPFSRASVDSALGGSGRFEALCKNCTNTNVLEDDGICVCAQAFDMIHVTWLSLSLSVTLTRLCWAPADM